ncbi:hypothetical protein [Streptomyces sp. NPDC001985]|uniref:hypothetical protein n=1 Tax=Streptomyces sp. NPDC001985 TaxID=3154406 RepID=UPI00332EBA4C
MRDDPTRRVPARAARRGRTARCAASAGLVLLAVLAPAGPAHARSADGFAGGPGGVARTADPVKFYVVKGPGENGGKEDALFDIASRTLGDGNRFQEILVLNTGRALPSGDLFVSAEQIGAAAGFALLLPNDAQGAEVRSGTLPGQAGGPASPPAATATAAPAVAPVPAARSSNPFATVGDRVPLPALFGGIAGVAVLTVAIIARRPLARGLRAAWAGVARAGRVLRPRLPRGIALALLRRRRGALAQRLAADTRTPVMVRQAVRELAGTRVYTVQAESAKLLASVSGGADGVPEGWTAVGPARWERRGLPAEIEAGGSGDTALTLPHLARVGIGERGAQVMVDLGRISGALSVRGDLRVAQDTVAALVHGLLELPRQSTVVVAIDPGAEVLPGLHGVVRVPSVTEVRGRAPAEVFEAAGELGLGLIRGAGRTAPVTGFLVALHRPTGEEARALSKLATPEGGGWTVLTVGDVPGAHWRWYAQPEGVVDLGVLDLRVTVPTQVPA